MEIILKYLNDPNLNIKTASVMGSFNNYNPRFGKMTLEEDYWVYSLKGEPGEHPYRFLINGEMALIDPESGFFHVDEEDKLWSLLYVNAEGHRMYNTVASGLQIETYYMYNQVTQDTLTQNKKHFNATIDKEVCVKFEFTEVVGLHNASVAWFSPQGDLLQMEDYPVYLEGTDATEVHLWSVLSLENIKKVYPIKGWRMNLIINGEFILEDVFEVQEGKGYSSQGKLI